VLNKNRRVLFVTPWRGRSLIGTAYTVYDADPEDFQVTERDVQGFLGDINQAYPPANLKREDVCFVHGGLVPIFGTDHKTGDIQLAKHYQIRDHRYEGWQGLLSVVGVKYTTARQVAEKTVDRVFETWGRKHPRSVSSVTPLYGGQIERFDTFLDTEIRKRPCGLGAEVVRHLINNYGAAYPDVLRYVDRHRNGGALPVDQSALLRAEVLHGLREEMAQKLTDIVLRRTDLGTMGHPGNVRLRMCAEVMGGELGWSPARTQRELHEAEAIFALGVKA
jgi:glycerol-3-phosphate dehydrogenase